MLYLPVRMSTIAVPCEWEESQKLHMTACNLVRLVVLELVASLWVQLFEETFKQLINLCIQIERT